MEKIFIKKIEKEEHYHQYYCDKCNKLMDECKEWDDGYIPNTPVETRYTIDNYIIKMLLCDDCKNKFLNDFYNVLEKLGFTKKGN